MQCNTSTLGIYDIAEIIVSNRHTSVMGFIAQVVLLPGSKVLRNLTPSHGKMDLLFGGAAALEVAALFRTLHTMDGSISGIGRIHMLRPQLSDIERAPTSFSYVSYMILDMVFVDEGNITL